MKTLPPSRAINPVAAKRWFREPRTQLTREEIRQLVNEEVEQIEKPWMSAILYDLEE